MKVKKNNLLITLAVIIASISCEKTDNEKMDLGTLAKKVFVTQIIYEVPQISIDTLTVFRDTANKIFKEIYSLNDTSRRLVYNAKFDYQEEDSISIHIKMQTMTFSSNSTLMDSMKLYCSTDSNNYITRCTDLNSMNYTFSYNMSKLIYRYFLNSCTDIEFSELNGDIIFEQSGCPCWRYVGCRTPNTPIVYEYTETDNNQGIYQNFQYFKHWWIKPIDHLKLIMNFLGAPNHHLVLKEYFGEETEYYFYNLDENGKIKVITIKNQSGDILRRESYTHFNLSN